jgi:hypothetical protein
LRAEADDLITSRVWQFMKGSFISLVEKTMHLTIIRDICVQRSYARAISTL